MNRFTTPVQPRGSRDLIQEATEHTPYVKYTATLRKLTVVGNASTEDAERFFAPFIEKVIDDLFERGYITLEFNFTTFGPKTTKVLFALFDNLRTFKQAGKSIEILWKYHAGDEAMAELGQSFSDLFELSFELIEK